MVVLVSELQEREEQGNLMIKSMTLKLFKIHKDSTLNFAPGLNVIRGESDNGKSAIFSALRWVTENYPSGDSFRTKGYGDDATEVEVVFDDGAVKRVRGNKENYYEFNDELYKAMRSDVPEEISDFIKFNDVNIQTQYQPFFLLSESPGEVARRLNSIVGLDIIDRAQKKINGLTTEAKSAIKHNEAMVDYYETSLLLYSGLELVEGRLNNLESSFKEYDKLQKDYDLLETSVSDILDQREKLKKVKQLLKIESDVTSILSVYQSIQEMEENCGKLTTLISKMEGCKTMIQEQSTILENEEKVLNLMSVVSDIEEKGKDLRDLKHMIKAIEIEEKKLKYTIQDVSSAMDEYEKEMANLGSCPLCGSELQ